MNSMLIFLILVGISIVAIGVVFLYCIIKELFMVGVECVDRKVHGEYIDLEEIINEYSIFRR